MQIPWTPYLPAPRLLSTVPRLPSPAVPRPPMPLPLASTVFDWQNLTPAPTPVGQFRAIVDSPTATFANFECHVTTLNPRVASHEPHHHPDEELVIVKEGTLEVLINGQAHRASAGSLIFIASNDHHGLRNPGDVPVTYHVMRIVV
jgi:mannose-6-phosphate isomerase-like protein (cupin superfamily)